MTTPHETAIEAAAGAMLQSFIKVIETSSGKPFEETGVSVPAGKIWTRYAEAAVAAYLSSIGGVVCAREPVAYLWRHHAYEDRPYKRPLSEKDVSAGFTAIPLHAPIEAGNGGDGWQDMSSAPKDDRAVWLGHECGFMEPAYFNRAGNGFWVNHYTGLPVQWKPRFWQRIPAPPSTPSHKGREKA
jgi:hypothetical protein